MNKRTIYYILSEFITLFVFIISTDFFNKFGGANKIGVIYCVLMLIRIVSFFIFANNIKR